jgi:hypothetical protein
LMTLRLAVRDGTAFDTRHPWARAGFPSCVSDQTDRDLKRVPQTDDQVHV